MTIKSYRDLRVWQSGMLVAERVYKLASTFPRHELYGLASQMQRAAVSVPSNIAEGHSREHTKEYLQHLAIAQGSLAELDTQLELARRLGYCTEADSAELSDQIRTLGRQLYTLRDSLRRKAKSSIGALAGVAPMLIVLTQISPAFLPGP